MLRRAVPFRRECPRREARARRICSPLGRNRRLRSERVRVRPSCPPCAFEMYASKMQPQPRRAASIAAMSIFFICIIASKARLAAAVSDRLPLWSGAIGVICQDNPHLSLHQPHALSSPPLPRNRRWGNRVRDLDQRVSFASPTRANWGTSSSGKAEGAAFSPLQEFLHEAHDPAAAGCVGSSRAERDRLTEGSAPRGW